MTSHIPGYRTLDETGELKVEPARRRDDRYDEAERSATAALFAGLFVGAGSTALTIWLVTLAL